MKKYLSLFIVLAVFILPTIIGIISEADWNPSDYARITEVDYKAEVVDEYGSNGKIIVTERLTFDIHAASENNLFWELWRDLPEEYIDGVKVEYKVNYVKQIFEDKPDLVYKQSPKLYWYDDDYINTAKGLGPGKWYHSKGPYDGEYNFECVLFYVDGLYRETVVFEIQYEMYNASLRYNDSSELYLSLYSGSSIEHLKSFKGQILFPNEKMPNIGNYNAYTYGTNNHSFDLTESDDINPGYHTFSFELDETQLKFKPYNQYIEFALISYGEDKHKFTQYASRNYYSYTDMLSKIRDEQAAYEELPEKYKRIKIVTLLLSSVGTVVIVLIASGINKKLKKKYNFYEPAMKMDYFRDIPSDLDPNFASTLVFCKHKPSDNIQDGYAAVMLSLVHKGYIELEKIQNDQDWDFSNVRIAIKYRPIQQQNISSFISAERRTIVVTKLRDADEMLNDEQKTWMKYLFRNGNTKYIVAAFDEFYKKSEGLVGNYIKIERDITENNNIEQQQTKKACPKCGNNNVIEAINCIFCATPFNNGFQVNQSQPIDHEEIIPNLKPLTPTEEQYFNLIIRHANGMYIPLKAFQKKVSSDYDYTNSFINNIKNSIMNIGVSQGYLQKAKYKEPKENAKGWAIMFEVVGVLLITVGNFASYQTRLDLAFGSFFILGIGFIASAIYLKAVSKKYILLTQFGEDEYAKWRGLYNFLNSETLMKERTVIELAIWEQYLIYATAFGISEKVIKALKIRCQDTSMSPVLRNPYFRTRAFYRSSHSFRTATRTASYTARSGGHGGYGGGGRGGGGGGGGH